MPKRTIPIEIPTLTGMILLISTLLQPAVCFRRIPAAVMLFTAHLWVLAVATALNAVGDSDLVVHQFLLLAQLILLLWVIYNLLSDARVVRGVVIAVVVSCVVRSAIQVLGVGTTSYTIWQG